MAGTAQHVCWICNKPVALETTKTDERGRAVHEECYIMVCAPKAAPPQKKADGGVDR